MKIAIVGAGAIGGLLGARLASAGQDVHLIDRGERLTVMQQRGLCLQMGGQEYRVEPGRVTGDSASLGSQDLVVLATKAHQVAAAAPLLGPLMDERTIVLTVQNGLPWWYFQRHSGPYGGLTLKSLDPDNVISRHIASERILGCVAYPAATTERPDTIRHIEGERFPVGELDGTESERATTVAEAFVSAGLKSRVLTDIRSEIWLKAWGSATFNPISALTGATMVEICRNPQTRRLVTVMMEEIQVVASRLGVVFRHPIEKRIAGAEAVGSHKTSMLQDVENGVEMELDALLTSILEIAGIVGVETPALAAVHGCVALLNERLRARVAFDTG